MFTKELVHHIKIEEGGVIIFPYPNVSRPFFLTGRNDRPWNRGHIPLCAVVH